MNSQDFPQVFDNVESDQYQIGSNSRAKAEKARKLGWKAKHTGGEVFAAVEEDFEHLNSKK